MTERALRWLGLGARAAERNEPYVRTAEFVIEEIKDLSAASAHEGELPKQREKARPEHPGDASAPLAERRRVSFTAIGPLRIRSVRVRVAAKVEAEFHYPAPALSGVSPDRITVATRVGIPVSLQAHAILPRDERGVSVAAELMMLGQRVGREAHVMATLVAKRR